MIVFWLGILSPNASFSKHTKNLSMLYIFVILTIFLLRIVWISEFIFSIGINPWSVTIGVPAGKQIFEILNIKSIDPAK